MREKYNNMVMREESQDWKQDDNGDKKWEIFREGMNNAAETVLGQKKRNQTDWFLENMTTLEILTAK